MWKLLWVGLAVFLFFMSVFIFWRLEEICNVAIRIKQKIIKIITNKKKTKITDWEKINFENDGNWYNKEVLIAHACGGNVRLDYTNSKEALIQSLKDGFKVIEVDVDLSSDGVLICNHDVNDRERLLANDFLKQKHDNRFTRMLLKTCFQEMSTNSVLLIDIKDKERMSQTLSALKQYLTLNVVKQKVFVQIFNEEDIYIANGLPILYNLTYTKDYERAAAFCLKNNIRVVSIYKKEFFKNTDWQILIKHNVKIYAHTVNKVEEYITLKNKGVQGVFTDFLIPSDIKELVV